ncbi:MAG: TolC family protein [Cyclobacteriaceae bacterium]|nr:TolC family protein [Cyclobacteriaceae bacterium]
MNYNLGLLATYYNISQARAQVIQAKVWNNPYFIFNGELWNSETNEYFRVSNQYLIQIEQTFSVAGKHTNAVRLARVNVELAEKQLEDVIRSLVFELSNVYNDVAALQEKEMVYRHVMANYDRLMDATRKQLEVGAISVTETVRLEAEYLAVKTNALNNLGQKEKSLSDLRTLLRLPADTVFYVEQRLPPVGLEFEAGVIAEQAITVRPDLQLSKLDVRYQEQNLKLQRSASVPDIKFGFQPIDKGSNYVRPYHGFTTEMSIPVFDRNQGRIKQAEYAIRQSSLRVDEAEIRIRNEVLAAYNRYRNSLEGVTNYNQQFLDRLRDLNRSADLNFQRRNISLLQFIDQQRIYILTNLQLIDMRQLYLNNVNELNFAVGTNLIEY